MMIDCHAQQAHAAKQRDSRRLMSDNTALLADLAELQRSNKSLTQKLAAATHQVAVLQQAQEDATSPEPAGGSSLTAADIGGGNERQPADRPKYELAHALQQPQLFVLQQPGILKLLLKLATLGTHMHCGSWMAVLLIYCTNEHLSVCAVGSAGLKALTWAAT